jgi:hypothetical protein
MSDELRAAAKAIMEELNDTMSYPRENIDLGMVEKLATACLAEHRDDDGEAVTEDWLVSIGFEPDRSGCPTISGLHIQCQTIVGERGREYPAYACIRSYPIPVPQTRRDVRDLCRVLGIEMKEETNG